MDAEQRTSPIHPGSRYAASSHSAAVLDDPGGVIWRALWGDGMVAVFGDVRAATRAAFAARRALPPEDRDRVRFGLHFDALPDLADPVLSSAPWFGVLAENVPALHDGAYVSDAFAARLKVQAPGEYAFSEPSPALAGARVLRRAAPFPPTGDGP